MKSHGFTRQSLIDPTLRNAAFDIFDMTNAILTLQETGGDITSSAAEQTMYINNAPLGTWRPVVMYIDLDNMIAGDTTVFRIYHRIEPGGALQLLDYQTYTGQDGGLANSIKLISIDLSPCRYGIRVTIQRTVQGDRDYAWSVFEEA